MDNKAMQGWLAADPPPPPRTFAPGEEHKWYKMRARRICCPRSQTAPAPQCGQPNPPPPPPSRYLRLPGRPL